MKKIKNAEANEHTTHTTSFLLPNAMPQVKHIVQELENQKRTSRNLYGVLFGQIALLALMTAVVFAAVMSGVELSKESHVRNGKLVTLNNTAVSVNTLTSSAGLMHVSSLPTEAFSKIKATTIVFDKGSSIYLQIIPNLLPLTPSLTSNTVTR